MRKKRRHVLVRGHAEQIGETTVRYTCPKGHTQVEDLGRASLPKHKRLSPSAVRLLARHWAPGTGVTFVCKTCTKLASDC